MNCSKLEVNLHCYFGNFADPRSQTETEEKQTFPAWNASSAESNIPMHIEKVDSLTLEVL